MKKITAIIIIMAFSFCGCSWFAKKEDMRTAQELADDGMANFNDGKYHKAIGDFEKLRNRYPFSRYLSLAELKLADSFFHMEEYEDAVLSYEHFESMHPANEAVPYVIYQIGMCYYEQLRGPDRDQAPSENALKNFNRLISQYPDSQYARKAVEPVGVCNARLAEHDFLVGEFYYEKEHYEAALLRFEKLLTHYKDVGIHHKALNYIALCKEAIKGQKLKKE